MSETFNISKRNKGQRKKGVLILAVFFVLSRMAYLFLFDVNFDLQLLDAGWQYIDIELLQGDLLNSLFYLHSQPPAYNLFLGIIIKLFPEGYEMVFHLTYFLVGYALLLLLFLFSFRLGLGFYPSLGIALYFLLSPAAILYENFLFYTYPLAALLLLSAHLLLLYMDTRKAYLLWWFSLVVFSMAMTRSMFHLVWIITVFGFIMVLLPYARRALLIPSLLCLLLVVGWNAKNKMLFNTFSASTWLGMNISSMLLPKEVEKLEALVEKGDASPIILAHKWNTLAAYHERDSSVLLASEQYPKIRVLNDLNKSNGETNYHHIGYIQASNDFKKASIASLSAYPKTYLYNLLGANLRYFTPSASYFILEGNYQKIAGYANLFNLDLARLLGKGKVNQNEPAWVLPLRALPLALVYLFAVYILLKLMWALIFKKVIIDKRLLYLSAYMLFNIAFVMLIGNALEVWENMRFRFLTNPLLLVLLVVLWQQYKRLSEKQQTRRRDPSASGA